MYSKSAFGITLSLFSWLVHAQAEVIAFPEKSVRIVLPFARGGSTDNFTRAMQPKLEAVLGQKILLENVLGGVGGSRGPEVAAAAAPDGYTLLVATVGNMALLPATYPAYGIQPLRDLAPVTMLADLPNVLVAHRAVPATTYAQLLALAKARPGQITFPRFGIQSIHGIEFAEIIKAHGIQLKEIANNGGSGGAMTAIQTGYLDLVMTTAPFVLPHVRSGAIRALAIAASARSAAFPDIPTMPEVGVPSLSVGSWMGIFVPAATPQPILNKLHAAAMIAAGHADVKNNANEYGMVVTFSKSPDAFKAFVASETARLQAIVSGLRTKQ